VEPYRLGTISLGALYTFAVLFLTIWLTIVAAAGLCYPRLPRAAGVLFLAAGGFMLAVWVAGAIGNAPPINAATSAMLGFGTLWKFRDSAARAGHVAEWRGRA
jgi:hypothetical protein